MTKIYTIGFTQKTARTFFRRISDSGATRLVDVRLNNVSQLAGFAKRDDLEYFLRELNDVTYFHDLRLAPTKPMLDSYKKHGMSWQDYAYEYQALMAEREIEKVLSPDAMQNTVLLCSESSAHHCHRRILAEYLASAWGSVEIEHL
ncbi:uncharacterized protein (DUF488 family) [Conyzicola lurida]|uniref:Uncharacterized protein (DUF488 family) n=1 Tax=Conyzicola lurida TaxID=1172621 RepID=A0A841AIC5_9MICO|nr:DUF488 domain-containing protein [Conyzicola lurida]MBB5842098.1 uncharacterized protein (DUF488 family) [Conyzicola lurida]